MNYRHLYHAGNFADVFKHVALTLMLRAFQKKDSAFCYLETHAGAGRYDFTEPAAQKSAEYGDGIGKLWDKKPTATALTEYLDIVRVFNPDSRLRFYPGSPLIAQRLL